MCWRMKEGVAWCGDCECEVGLGGVGAHVRAVHVGGGGDAWACGECAFRGLDLDEVARHCLLLRHSAARLSRDPRPTIAALARIQSLFNDQHRLTSPAPLVFTRPASSPVQYRPMDSHKMELLPHTPQDRQDMYASDDCDNEDAVDSAKQMEPEAFHEDIPAPPPSKRLEVAPRAPGAVAGTGVECDLCGKTVAAWKPQVPKTLAYLDNYKLRIHVMRHHLATKDLYKCAVCPFTAIIKERIKTHAQGGHDFHSPSTQLRRQILSLLLQCFPMSTPKLQDQHRIDAFIKSF